MSHLGVMSTMVSIEWVEVTTGGLARSADVSVLVHVESVESLSEASDLTGDEHLLALVLLENNGSRDTGQSLWIGKSASSVFGLLVWGV
jgi:hypothetical protein